MGAKPGQTRGDLGSNAGQTGSIPGDFCLYNPHVPAPGSSPHPPPPWSPTATSSPPPAPSPACGSTGSTARWRSAPGGGHPPPDRVLPPPPQGGGAPGPAGGKRLPHRPVDPKTRDFPGFPALTLQKHLVVELPQAAPLEEVKAQHCQRRAVPHRLPGRRHQGGDRLWAPLLCQALAAHSLAAETVSGALRLEGVSARQLACNAVSGKAELLGFSCATLKGETVSGALTATGSGEEDKAEHRLRGPVPPGGAVSPHRPPQHRFREDQPGPAPGGAGLYRGVRQRLRRLPLPVPPHRGHHKTPRPGRFRPGRRRPPPGDGQRRDGAVPLP